MVVLQINAVYAKASTGRTTKELHEFMLQHGIESYVAAAELYGLSERCHRIGNQLEHKIHAFMSRVTGLQGYYSIRSTQGLIRYMKEIKPDIVHLRNLHSNYINLKILLNYLANNDISTVITLHDSWLYTGKCVYYIEDNCRKFCEQCRNCPAIHKGNNSIIFDWSRKMQRDKRKLFSKIRNMAVIGVSQWVTNDATQSLLKDARLIKTIYNWIDLDVFIPKDREKARRKLGLPLDKKILLGVAANWVEQKGIRIFLDLAERISDDSILVLVGRPASNMYHHKRIQYVGEVKEVNILSEYYSASDIFINPSIQETFGKTTAEAMACGIPVIAYESTAMPELMGNDGQCGELVQKNSVETYYCAVRKVLSNDQEFYRKNCRTRAQILFERENNINQYIRVYKELLHK